MLFKKFKCMRGHAKCLIWKNRIISTALVLGMLCGLPLHVSATATQQKNQAQSNLDKTNAAIDDLEDQAAAVDAELSEKGEELAQILDAQAELEVDITATEDAIAQSEIDLENAQAQEAQQYANMKLRIQFMYENSTADSYWTAILGANGIADMLNRLEYVQQVEEADRDMLDEYEATVQEITDLKAGLEEQDAQLLAMQDEYQAQENQVNAIISELEASASDYAQQIEDAQAMAASYKKQIEEANKQIAAEEAAKKKAAEEAAAAAKKSGSSSSSSNNNYSGSSGVNPAQATNVSGSDIVAYAMQYVGGPYVWGGGHKYTLADRQAYNISNGVDCSGFVSCVYAHFGIYTPNYSTAFAYSGQEVSADCMQPGDVIVYGTKNGIGHVAIYAGNGLIIEAQSTAAGITANRAWNCRSIVAIRRYV